MTLPRKILAAALFPFFLLTPSVHSQEWPHVGGDAGGSRYSPLKQITKENVSRLEVAWEHDTGDFSDGTNLRRFSAFEATPLVIDGVMYVSTPFHRLLALDPETGDRLWLFDSKFDKTARVSLYTSRGLAYWSDGEQGRIFLADQMARLFSLDVATGKPDPKFADRGMLDLRRGITEKFPDLRYYLTSPVAVCGDVVIAGSRVSDGEAQGPPGDIRGFDARTGKQLWRFHSVPRPGEFGNDTWEGDSWKDRSGVNAWSLLSVDEKRGMVFVPLTSPGTDFYGGDRKGANLFSNCVVALDCKTGRRRWHFQTVHHDLWDWDLPAQPSLVTVRRSGREIPAVAQITKLGFVYLLDRLTGRPLFEVQERPVPPSKIPGEHSSPTQPFPVKPPPFARQTMTMDDITDVTSESRAECLEMVKDALVESPMFRPIGTGLTVMFPGTNGGANWGGASFDPTTGVLYVNSMDLGGLYRMVKRPQGSKTPYRVRGTKWGRFWDSNQYPCQKPPWGSLTAIDLETGEFRWQSTLGVVDELMKRGIPKTGAPNLGGPIVTAGGLVFIGATNDKRFRAFDKDTGEELWVTRLPESGHATPMTYLGRKTGKQFVVIAAGGGNDYNKTAGGKVVAFALP